MFKKLLSYLVLVFSFLILSSSFVLADSTCSCSGGTAVCSNGGVVGSDNTCGLSSASAPSCSCYIQTNMNLDDLSKLGGHFSDASGKNVGNIANNGHIKTANDVPVIINNLIGVILGVFATIILGVIIYAGVLMINSKGKIETYQEGMKLLRTAVIAMIIILLAYAVSSFVLKTISFIAKGSS